MIERRVLRVSVLALALTGGAGQISWVAGQEAPRAVIVAKSADNAGSGTAEVWDFGATDVTFKATAKELWVLDPYSNQTPAFIKFKADSLATPPTAIPVTLPEALTFAPVLGLAEIPHGPLKGLNLILVDPSFGNNQADPAPQMALYTDDGKLAPGEIFFPLDGLPAGVQLASIDVNPVREEIVAYDITNHALFFFDFSFGLIKGPIALQGFADFFTGAWSVNGGLRGSGVGVAYDGPDRVLVTAAFRNVADSPWALAYDLTREAVYSGLALDLGGAAESGRFPNATFHGIATGKIGEEPVLFAYNLADDSLYAFGLTLQSHPAPLNLTACALEASGAYSLGWTLPADAASYDGISILENGTVVATLGPEVTQYTAPLPLLGRVEVSVAARKGGFSSGLHLDCLVTNGGLPGLDGVTSFGSSRQVQELGNLTGLAVDPLPGSAADFRGYVIGPFSTDMVAFNSALDVLDAEVYITDPRIETPLGSNNLSAIGATITEDLGKKVMAILDPDGPLDNNIPSATFFSLESLDRGKRVREFPVISLAALTTQVRLRDWDAGSDGNFVASGIIPASGEPVIVRIRRNGENLFATQMAAIPHRLLSPFALRGLPGAGVSILPSGNLLVASGTTFDRTYTEALLMTPFLDVEVPDDSSLPRFVGYSQGLRNLDQFFRVGPGIGPNNLFGLDTAYFPPPEGAPEGTPGTGVTYVPAGNVVLISNPAINDFLAFLGQVIIHQTNHCAHPDLQAEQLVDEVLDIPAGATRSGTPGSPRFGATLDAVDYFVYVLNNSLSEGIDLQVRVLLDGAEVVPATSRVFLPAGRLHRLWMRGRREKTLQVDVASPGAREVSVRVITGSMAVGKVAPPGDSFRRGDPDANSLVNLTDAIFGLNYLFRGGPEPSCLDAADTDDDGKVTLTDMVFIVNFLFKGGQAPADPGPVTCGLDTTLDELSPCTYPCEG